MSNYFNTVVMAEWIAFLAAIFFLWRDRSRWRLFIPYLLLIHAVEIYGWYQRAVDHMHFNGLPFNILLLVSVLFQAWFLASYCSAFVKKVTLFAMGAFLMFGIVNLLFFQGAVKYNSKSDVLGNIMLALLCCSILYRLATSEKFDMPLMRLDYFWLTTGIFITSLGSAVHYVVQQPLYEYYLQTKINLGYYINTGLNIILYACMIMAFYCRWRIGRSPLASPSPVLSS